MLRTIIAGSAIALSLSLAPGAIAATVTGQINDNTGYQSQVSNTDLLQTNLSGSPATPAPTNFTKEGTSNGMGEPALRNGSFEALGGQQGATAGEGDSVVYTLDTSANPLGYTVNQVNTFAGWSYGRYGQAYDLSFHVVGTPVGTFTTSIPVSYGPGTNDTSDSPFPGDPHGNFSTFVAVTDPSGVLATAVDQVKFVFHQSPNYVGDYDGYRELDVIGTAVPEPTSIAMLGLGSLTLLARRRRA